MVNYLRIDFPKEMFEDDKKKLNSYKALNNSKRDLMEKESECFDNNFRAQTTCDEEEKVNEQDFFANQ
jgi:hypothetical protein